MELPKEIYDKIKLEYPGATSIMTKKVAKKGAQIAIEHVKNEITRIVSEVIEQYPYKVVGKHDTYCDYNQGWADACDILEQQLLTALNEVK